MTPPDHIKLAPPDRRARCLHDRVRGADAGHPGLDARDVGGRLTPARALPKTQLPIKVAFAKTKSGRFVGAFHSPYLPCHGTLTLLRQEADRYIWRENVTPWSHCIDRSIITFKLTPTGDLWFKEYEPTTGAQDAYGTLHRTH